MPPKGPGSKQLKVKRPDGNPSRQVKELKKVMHSSKISDAAARKIRNVPGIKLGKFSVFQGVAKFQD